MKRPILSICIPTYNRASELDRLIRDCLESTRESDFEIVVSDNCSSDDTLERLGRIDDARLRILHSDRNMGSWENGARVLTSGAGKYSMILMDKDLMNLKRIGDVLPVLSRIDVAAGRITPDVENYETSVSCTLRKGIHDILLKEGLKFSHPSGYFFRTEILKREDVFGRLRSADPVLRPYSTDFQVLMMAKHGPFAVIRAPLVYLQLPPFKGVARSFTYREDEDLFFMPQYQYKVLVAYVNMMRELMFSPLLRFRAIAKYVRFLHRLSTDVYVSVLDKDNICDWYGLSRTFREQQKQRPLQKEFRDRFDNNDNLNGLDGAVARACAFLCTMRAIKREKRRLP